MFFRQFNFSLSNALFTSALITFSTIGSAAYAQTVDVPGSADAGQASQSFERDEPFAPRVLPQIKIDSLRLQTPPPGAESVAFVLEGIDFDGLTAYDKSEIRYIYADRIGKEITLSELYDIANTLTKKFRNDGYILTQVVVPPQTIDGGFVQLQIVEGFVNRVIVKGEDRDDITLVRKYAQQITKTRPVSSVSLERHLLFIQDLPGIKTRSVLSPSEDQPGGADLTIFVERDLQEYLASVDNFGSRYLGRLQLTGAAQFNSIFQNNESILAQFVVAPDDNLELAYGYLGYTQPINQVGTMFDASYSYTETHPGFTLDQFDVEGRATNVDVGLTHPFIRSRTENFSIRGGIEYGHVESENNLEPDKEDRIRRATVGASYEFLDTWFNVGVNNLDIQIAKGINVFDSSESSDANLSRANADPLAYVLFSEFQSLQRINNDFNLLVAVKGQLASNDLLSSHEFSVGGISYGRGYDSSEIVGDKGFAAKAELRWNTPYDIEYINNYQLYTFYDVGRVYNIDSTSEAQERDSLASVGFGIRANLNDVVSGEFLVGMPVTREVQTEGDKDPRFLFSLSARF